MRRTLLFISLTLLAIAASSHAATANYQVVPQPKDILLTGGQPFMLDASCLIVCADTAVQMRRNAAFLAEYVKTMTGLTLVQAAKAPKTASAIRLAVSAEPMNAEGYRLTVSGGSRTITIEGGTARGVFYGIQTLRKSLATAAAASPSDGTAAPVLLPSAVITDHPRFSYRGMHLDVCRHFFTVEQVKEYLDIMALHNMNVFHWHLTDDQGWRMESKRYPRLHQVGSQRRHTVIGRNTGLFDDTPHGGYYTQEQLRDVVRYAQERCITVIPEVEMPGHALAILAAYPELGCTGGPYEVEPTWGVFDDILCAGNDRVFDFLSGVIEEVAAIFPSPYINIGGDEAPKRRWEQCPKCQQRIREEGIKGDSTFSAESKLQGYFTNRMEQVIRKLGRNIIGWDEIMEGDISPSATVLCWRGIEHGVRAAREGHDVIMAPTAYSYFDYYQTDENTTWHKPLLIGGFVPLEKVYSYEPLPDSLDEQTLRHIIGVQANMWTEYIPWRQLLLYQLLPRAAALSETQWVAGAQKDYASFLQQRLPPLLRIYSLAGWNYCPPRQQE